MNVRDHAADIAPGHGYGYGQGLDCTMRPLHIVYVASTGGGLDTYARQMAHALCRRGQRVTLLYLCPPGAQARGPAREGPAGLAYVTIPNTHYYYSRARALLPRWTKHLLPYPSSIKQIDASLAIHRGLHHVSASVGRIDLIEMPEEPSFPLLNWGLPPYVVRLHGSAMAYRYFCGEGLRRDDRRRLQMEGGLLRWARLVTAPSAAVADYVAAACRYPRARIAVMHNPLDITRFTPSNDSAVPDGRLSVLFVGRVETRKGIWTLARAARTILSAYAKATIDVVGAETAEANRRNVLAMVPDAVRSRVIFHGRISHAALPDYYRRAAVCVVPSQWECWGYTAAEAMACGVPVVASRAGGLPELVVEGETGLLVRANDHESLAAAVMTLLGNPARRVLMGRAARARAVAQFGIDGIAERMLCEYRHALSYSSHSGAMGRPTTDGSAAASAHAGQIEREDYSHACP